MNWRSPRFLIPLFTVFIALSISTGIAVYLLNRPLSLTQQCPPAPPSVKEIPKESSGGIDLNSPMVQASIQEIQKLYPSLASGYRRDTQLSTGLTVEILIPGKEYQYNKWVLAVGIHPINYNTSLEQSDYQLMKKSFLEAANILFTWIRIHNVDPLKILFDWGGRAFIQNAAEKWLHCQDYHSY